MESSEVSLFNWWVYPYWRWMRRLKPRSTRISIDAWFFCANEVKSRDSFIAYTNAIPHIILIQYRNIIKLQSRREPIIIWGSYICDIMVSTEKINNNRLPEVSAATYEISAANEWELVPSIKRLGSGGHVLIVWFYFTGIQQRLPSSFYAKTFI